MIRFQVTELAARVADGVPVEWQGRQFSSGRLEISLDPAAASRGALDYDQRRATAEFHVTLSFPEFAETLRDLGADPALTRPVKAVLRSAGEILDDHSFALSGDASIEPHAMFPVDQTRAGVLPGT
jgi:hypothetical protein